MEDDYRFNSRISIDIFSYINFSYINIFWNRYTEIFPLFSVLIFKLTHFYFNILNNQIILFINYLFTKSFCFNS